MFKGEDGREYVGEPGWRKTLLRPGARVAVNVAYGWTEALWLPGRLVKVMQSGRLCRVAFDYNPVSRYTVGKFYEDRLSEHVASRVEQRPDAPVVHHFYGSGDAYHATQCREDIQDGDVLLIEESRIVGIAWTWPFAITEGHGELHRLDTNPRTYQGGLFAPGVSVAVRIARQLGFPLQPHLT